MKMNERVISTQLKLYPRHSRLWLTLSRLDELLCVHAPKAKGRLLDIGGENTPYIEYFRPHVKEYICLNMQRVKNSADKNVIGNALSLPFAPNSMDTILSTQVLEHLKEPQKAVDEMHRVLKKGGYCLLSTNMAWIYHAVPDDYFRFTESGLRHLFRNFSEIKTYSTGGYVLTIAQLVLLPLKPLPFFVAAPLFWLINTFADILDRIFYSTKLTPIVIVVARK